MVRSLYLLSAASAVALAAEETRVSLEDAAGDKQFWIGNRFRRPFPLRTRHKPGFQNTIQTPLQARDAADRLLFGWNQGNEAAILRLMATGAFVEDYSMLSLPVMTQFGDSEYINDYVQAYQGRGYNFRGSKNVTSYATAMSCMTRKDVTTDEDCCKTGGLQSVLAETEGEAAWWWNDFCSQELFMSTKDMPNRVVETSFTATSDGFVAEYKYVMMEADCASAGNDNSDNFGEAGVAVRYSEGDCFGEGLFDGEAGNFVGTSGDEDFIERGPDGATGFVQDFDTGRRLSGSVPVFAYEGVEFDFAVKAAVDNYGRFRRLSVYATADNFYDYENDGYSTEDGEFGEDN